MSLDLPDALWIVAALCFLAWEVRRLVLARASETWPHTTGRVLEAYMDETRDHDGDVEHRAHVRYTYTVGQTRHVSGRLTYAGIGVGYREQLETLHGIVKGRDVDVFYDPRSPSRSVLRPGSSTGNVVGIVIGIVLVAIAVGNAL